MALVVCLSPRYHVHVLIVLQPGYSLLSPYLLNGITSFKFNVDPLVLESVVTTRVPGPRVHKSWID
jgi:hypothetical protein